MNKSNINPIMYIITIKRCRFSPHHDHTIQILHITTPLPRRHPNKKTSPSHLIAESST
jgi:hypothetical protein